MFWQLVIQLAHSLLHSYTLRSKSPSVGVIAGPGPWTNVTATKQLFFTLKIKICIEPRNHLKHNNFLE